MSSLSTPDPLQQLRANVRAIVTEVERLTGLTSNWSGTVTLRAALDASGLPLYLGAKSWNC